VGFVFREKLHGDTDCRYRLEERRKVKGAAYYERKKAARRQLSEAKKTASVDQKVKDKLAEYGY
jgi:large subunit ribosomal protein L13Ae